MGVKKLKSINQDLTEIQGSLFAPNSVKFGGLEESGYPELRGDAIGWREVIRRSLQSGYIGIDYEFKRFDRPTIMGIADRTLAVGLKFDRALHGELEPLRKAGVKFVAHSGYGADKPVYDWVEGVESDPLEWIDSMLLHWFQNAHLTKAPQKDESDDAGALGFMDLYSAASLVVDVPNWKACRGSACQGPCPTHEPFNYCAVDAWAGLEIALSCLHALRQRGFNWSTFTDRSLLAYYLEKMQSRGMRVDWDYLDRFNARSEEIKEGLFPLNEEGGQTPFNPRSSDQVLAWAKANGISLSSNQKNDVRKTLEKTAARFGFSDLKELDEADELPPVVEVLYRLDQFKGSGKGSDAWFDRRYVSKEDGLLHPRYIYVGTSTSRLSCAKPNFTNLPSRGWGDLLKGAVIPHDPEKYDIIDADLGQLELRAVLYQAGYPVETIKGDALSAILEKSKEPLQRAAEIAGGTARDILKTVVYGGQYGEGVQIYTPDDMRSPVFQRMLSKGAIRLYTPEYVKWLDHPWEYAGGIIGFTGANLAERLFGDKKEESRRKALEIQDDIIFAGDLRIIREWQIKVSREIESKGFLQLPNTHGLRMLGSAHKNFKVGLAFLGQGFGAMHAQATMLEMIRRSEKNHLPLLQVHDSLVYAVLREWPDQQVREFMVPFFSETPLIPGFKAPGKVKRGRNYGSYHAEHNSGGLRQIWDSSKEDVCGNKL